MLNRFVRRLLVLAAPLYCVAVAGLAGVPQAGRAASFAPVSLPHWQACLAGMQAGQNRCTIMYMGDSTVQSAENNSYGDTQQNVTYWLANQLTGEGIPADQNGFCGSGGTTTRFATDARITRGVWVPSGQTGLGGQVLATQATSGAPMLFTPGVPVNTFSMLWYNSGNATGSFTTTPSGGTPVTLTNTRTKALQMVVMSSPGVSAANALALGTATAASNMFVSCIMAYDSTHAAADIYNAGDYGANTGSWVSSAAPDGPIPTLKFLAPVLTIVESGINDPTVQMPVATYTANLQTIISAAQASGDVILVTGNYALNHASGPYFNAVRQLGVTDNIPVLSIDQLWVSPVVARNTVPPLLGPDYIHPSSSGAMYIAHALAQMLAP
jgi:hypothetical protein